MPGPFTPEDYLNLSRLLLEHPELRADLRRLVLSEEILELPAIVRELAAAQQRTEARLEELAAAQRGTEERLDALVETVSRLEAAQQRTEERLNALIETVNRLVAAQERMDQRLVRLENTYGSLIGRDLERDYRDKASAYFGILLRGVRRVDIGNLDPVYDSGLTEGELRDLLQIDLVLSGTLRRVENAPSILLALEVSAVVDRNDVERAVRRAGLLRRADPRLVIPVVAGESVTVGGDAAARAQHVLLLQDGREENWRAALQAWAGIEI